VRGLVKLVCVKKDTRSQSSHNISSHVRCDTHKTYVTIQTDFTPHL
jgi:hypothetical protein